MKGAGTVRYPTGPRVPVPASRWPGIASACGNNSSLTELLQR